MTAQVVTITEYNSLSFPFKKIIWDWACTEAGVVTGSITTNSYSGTIERLITNPDAATDNPTDNYDVSILDDDGYDVLMGAGADRDTTNTEQVLRTSLGVCMNSKLTLEIASAGDAKKGVVILYIK